MDSSFSCSVPWVVAVNLIAFVVQECHSKYTILTANRLDLLDSRTGIEVDHFMPILLQIISLNEDWRYFIVRQDASDR